jgi:hypothetical protein
MGNPQMRERSVLNNFSGNVRISGETAIEIQKLRKEENGF